MKLTKVFIRKTTFTAIPACLSRMLSGFKKDAGLRRELRRTTSQHDKIVIEM